MHLIHAELFDELMACDFAVWPDDLGENVTTSGMALMAALPGRDVQGRLQRKAGVMAVVISGGEVRANDAITIELPAPSPRALEPV